MMDRKKPSEPIETIINARKCVLTEKDTMQVAKYYSALLELYSKEGVDLEQAVTDLIELLSAADNGDTASVYNITQHPEELALRYKKVK